MKTTSIIPQLLVLSIALISGAKASAQRLPLRKPLTPEQLQKAKERNGMLEHLWVEATSIRKRVYAHLRAREWSFAEAGAQHIEDLDPVFANEASELRGVIDLREGAYVDAVREFEKASGKEEGVRSSTERRSRSLGGSSDTWLILALALRGDFTRAEAILRDALIDDPGNFEAQKLPVVDGYTKQNLLSTAWLCVAKREQVIGEYDDAVLDLNRAHTLVPKNTYVAMEYADALVGVGRLVEAASVLEAASHGSDRELAKAAARKRSALLKATSGG